MRTAPPLSLTDEQHAQLTRYARGRNVSVRLSQRARIVLLAAEGRQNKEIATMLGTTPPTVARWRLRFLHKGIAGIEKDAPRSGRKPVLAAATVEEIIRKTMQEKPAGATQWSTRKMARATGVSEASVRRIWRKHGLKPHRIKSFKLSNDPRFVEKLEDVVGLYLNPPEHALVLSLDEKSQIQALDRTQPGLPMKKGRCQTMTHDYKRHGTTTLFAALNTFDGTVIGTCMKRHTHQEWLKFLQLIDRQTPPDKELHLIVDNYATHKHPRVKRWFAARPRFHVHFTPTYASWLNQVEIWFNRITQQAIRRGTFRSVKELVEKIDQYVQTANNHAQPFVWTATTESIFAKVQRLCERIPRKGH